MRCFLAFLPATLLCVGCQTIPLRTSYDPIGYKPENPENVVIKVSLQNRMVYVMEGSKPLLVTATAIGLPSKPTPRGRFHVANKIANKRSGTYGFWVKGNTIIAGKSSQPPGSGYRYVGFPMQYWVEWMPAYGFHVGSVWPVPRTHGCLRLHQNAAREFFKLARLGTPVYIGHTQPEDATLGKNPPRPQDYNDPDPPKSVLISSHAFKDDPTQDLREQP
ncbi:MAG TPA: L,D-transpeptidase [Terrimicrobiaceae bacterium]